MSTAPPNKPTPIVKCPSCQQTVKWTEASKHRPFCSQRCRDADFCDWANEEHKLPGNASYDDYFSEDAQTSSS